MNRRWNRYTNRLSGLEVDKKLKFRGLLNRKIGGVRPFEDLVDARACASVQGRHVESIGCKHAGFPLLASKCNGRQSLAGPEGGAFAVTVDTARSSPAEGQHEVESADFP